MPPKDTTPTSVIASLYIQAVRQGQSLWFRVASNSMVPLLRIEDSVYIEPVKAHEIHPGEIAAFETASGLVIHRIVYSKQEGDTVRLLQMSDVDFRPSWIEEQAIVGRVVARRRGNIQLDLRHPIAQWYGRLTAHLRYQVYLWKKWRLLQVLLRGCSRIVVLLGYWSIRCCCRSPLTEDKQQ